ncbi:MAG TPA: glycosyltransferase, partial [Burkholderiaceae bacterium]
MQESLCIVETRIIGSVTGICGRHAGFQAVCRKQSVNDRATHKTALQSGNCSKIKPMKLSVIIITKNEAQYIRACLDSVKFANEWIIVDSGSTDGTQ